MAEGPNLSEEILVLLLEEVLKTGKVGPFEKKVIEKIFPLLKIPIVWFNEIYKTVQKKFEGHGQAGGFDFQKFSTALKALLAKRLPPKQAQANCEIICTILKTVIQKEAPEAKKPEEAMKAAPPPEKIERNIEKKEAPGKSEPVIEKKETPEKSEPVIEKKEAPEKSEPVIEKKEAQGKSEQTPEKKEPPPASEETTKKADDTPEQTKQTDETSTEPAPGKPRVFGPPKPVAPVIRPPEESSYSWKSISLLLLVFVGIPVGAIVFIVLEENYAYQDAIEKGTVASFDGYLTGRTFAFHYTEIWKKRDEKKLYDDAIKDGHKVGYEDFLKKFPESKFAAQIKHNLQELETYKKAAKKGTKTELVGYLEKFSEDKHADPIKKKLQEIDWLEKARKEETKEAYEEFLKNYPEGKFKNAAENELNELIMYEKAMASATHDSLERFIRNWPQGIHSKKVRTILPEAELFEKALNAEDPKLFSELQQKFPEGFFKETAAKALEELPDYLAARKDDGVPAFEAFIAKHKDGKYVEAGRLLLNRKLILNAVDSRDLDGLRKLSQGFSDSGLLEEAGNGIDGLTYLKLCAKPTIPAIEAYLKEFPKGIYSENCRRGQDREKEVLDAMKSFEKSKSYISSYPTDIWSPEIRRQIFGKEFPDQVANSTGKFDINTLGPIGIPHYQELIREMARQFNSSDQGKIVEKIGNWGMKLEGYGYKMKPMKGASEKDDKTLVGVEATLNGEIISSEPFFMKFTYELKLEMKGTSGLKWSADVMFSPSLTGKVTLDDGKDGASTEALAAEILFKKISTLNSQLDNNIPYAIDDYFLTLKESPGSYTDILKK